MKKALMNDKELIFKTVDKAARKKLRDLRNKL